MNLLNKVQGSALSLYRIVVGLFFLSHGAASLFGVFGGAMFPRGGTVPFGTWPGWYAAVIQLVGGALLMLGLGTRVAALVCSGSMAYAYFVVHQEKALWPIENGGEAAAMFCWAFALIAVLGAGPWSVDALISKARSKATATDIPTPQAVEAA